MTTTEITAVQTVVIGGREHVVTTLACVFCKGTGAAGAVRTAGQCVSCLGFGRSLADGVDAAGRPYWS